MDIIVDIKSINPMKITRYLDILFDSYPQMWVKHGDKPAMCSEMHVSYEYLPTKLRDFVRAHVGTYSRTMEDMGLEWFMFFRLFKAWVMTRDGL